MKKIMALLLALCLPLGALAEVDVLALQNTEGMMAYTLPGGVDTVIRPVDQPFFGQVDLEDGELVAFLDFVDMPNENRVFLRLTVSIVTPEMIGADTMTLAVGKKSYTFGVQGEISEYDTIYYEDYVVCLTDKSMPILDDLIKLDGAPVQVTLTAEGVAPAEGSVSIPAQNVQEIVDLYQLHGGMTQDFAPYEETWPVTITK